MLFYRLTPILRHHVEVFVNYDARPSEFDETFGGGQPGEHAYEEDVEYAL